MLRSLSKQTACNCGCRYGKDIADKSTLLTTLRTNKAYANLTHPMKSTSSGKWVPDFMHR
jgi:hypothetical protein